MGNKCDRTPQTHTFSAWYLTFGRPPIVPTQFQFGVLPDGTPNPANYAEQTAQNLDEALKFVTRNVAKYEARKKLQYDKSGGTKDLIKFNCGDLVYLYIGNRGHGRSVRGLAKVLKRWQGPCFISSFLPSGVDYKLRNARTGEPLPSVYHANMLKPAFVHLEKPNEESQAEDKQCDHSQNNNGDAGQPDGDEDKPSEDELPQGWYAIKKIVRSCYVPRTKERIYQVLWVEPKGKKSWVKAEDITPEVREAFHAIASFYARKQHDEKLLLS